VSDVARSPAEEYASALHEHLMGSQGRTLVRAHELGRRAVDSGLGVLDVAEAHHGALAAALAGASTPREGAQVAKRAAAFLAEALVPFEERTRHHLEGLAALRNIDIAIAGSLDLRVALNAVLDPLTDYLRVDAAVVSLLDPRTQTLEYAAGRGFRTPALRGTRLRVGEGYAGRAVLERRIVHIPDLVEAPGPFVRSPLLVDEGFVTYYAVPLVAKGQVKGVLEIFHRGPLHPGLETWPVMSPNRLHQRTSHAEVTQP
jgi:hypothetical protein